MLAFLPLASGILLLLIFHQKEGCWRSAGLSAATAFGFLLTLITEFLSIFKLLVFGWLLGLWVLTLILLSLAYVRSLKKGKRIVEHNDTPPVRKPIKVPLFSACLLGSVAFIAIVVGLIALVTPPNNYDSMTYHMARVAHWVQNHSVEHYPTEYLAQLILPPWSEFSILHFQLLSGSDRFANLVQWFSMVGSIFGISLISKQLGADWRGQILSAVIVATIPMGILQASSTQNDYVVAFWLVCFTHYILLITSGKNRWTNFNLLALGASFGLALLSKGTAYVYAFPFLIWLFISGIRSLRWQLWKPAFRVAILALSILTGYYLRNLELFGSLFGTPKDWRYTNEAFSPQIWVSNIIRNISLHVGTLSGYLNKAVEKLVLVIHTFLGVDVNDPRITWQPEGMVFHIQKLSTHEDRAGNPIHLLLIVSTIILCLKNWKSHKPYIHYCAALIGCFLTLCLIIAWQPYNSRLHLPFFVLSSPLVSIILSKTYLNRKVVNFIAIGLILSSLLYVFHNSTRPIVKSKNIFNTSRIEQYFRGWPERQSEYIGAVDFLRHQRCSDIGLTMAGDEFEYPLWVLLQENKDRALRFEHINVTNNSASKTDINFKPCAIIYVDSRKVKDRQNRDILTSENIYVQKWSLGQTRVLIRQ
jgi:hypothetical protein